MLDDLERELLGDTYIMFDLTYRQPGDKAFMRQAMHMKLPWLVPEATQSDDAPMQDRRIRNIVDNWAEYEEILKQESEAYGERRNTEGTRLA